MSAIRLCPFPAQRDERFQATPLGNARGRSSDVATKLQVAAPETRIRRRPPGSEFVAASRRGKVTGRGLTDPAPPAETLPPEGNDDVFALLGRAASETLLAQTDDAESLVVVRVAVRAVSINTATAGREVG